MRLLEKHREMDSWTGSVTAPELRYDPSPEHPVQTVTTPRPKTYDGGWIAIHVEGGQQNRVTVRCVTSPFG